MEIDARGLSCPQPVIETKKVIDKKVTELAVLVDNIAAKENVSRAAIAQGWEIADIKPENDGYKITLRKGK